LLPDTELTFSQFTEWYEPTLWEPSRVRSSNPPEYPYNEAFESDLPPKVCNYPLNQEILDFAAYERYGRTGQLSNPGLITPKLDVPDILKSVLGPWYGYKYRDNGNTSASGMISFTLKPQEGASVVKAFKASSRSNQVEFTIIGTCEEREGNTEVSFKRNLPSSYPSEYWKGEFDLLKQVITGTVAYEENGGEDRLFPFTFYLCRTTPEILRFRPTPADFEERKTESLWKYAIEAIVAQIQRDSWSWSYFRKRRDTRRRFLELWMRRTCGGTPLTPEEQEELTSIRHSLTAQDGRFYHSIAARRIRNTIVHG